MSELTAYGNKITSVFQLIGTQENDITKSIAWALVKCPAFLTGIMKEILDIDIVPDNVRLQYQTYEKERGITDLEITDDEDFYVIIEAKRGWVLPSVRQLTLYSERKCIQESNARYKKIVSMSECSMNYADVFLPAKEINGIPVSHLSWKRICEIAEASLKESNNREKSLLKELINYLGGIMNMQNQKSNMVYVVALSDDKVGESLGESQITFQEVVEKYNKYFHPLGINGWPKEAPNYIAFRYGGQLQSIHHIESYTVTRNLHEQIEELKDKKEENNYFVYRLGKKIIPPKAVKTGNIYRNGRCWAMIDTLLTSDTISEARDITKERMGE